MPKPPEQREAGPATDSSGYARRHHGSRNRNRTGPRRSMRSAARTCSVRAAASPRESFRDEIHFPDFQRGPPGRCRARSSGAHVRVPNSDLELPGARWSSRACRAPLACCSASLEHLEMFSPRCPQHRVGANESPCSRRRGGGRGTPG